MRLGQGFDSRRLHHYSKKATFEVAFLFVVEAAESRTRGIAGLTTHATAFVAA